MQTIRMGSLTFRTGKPQQLVDLVSGPRTSGKVRSLGYVNPHVYNQARRGGVAREFLEACDFVCLDGIGTAWAARIGNQKPLSRIVMDQAFDACLASGALRGRALLVGLPEEENARAARNLRLAAPGLELAGSVHGFHAPKEYPRILREFSGVDYVLAGMGTPGSERVLMEARERCPGALGWHVGGGTLRNWAGTKRRSPRLLSRLGLEWLHRTLCEPQTRSRYLFGAPAFAGLVVYDALRRSTT